MGPEKVQSIVRKGKPVRASAQLQPWCELALNQNFLRILFPGQGKPVRRVGESRGKHLEKQDHPALAFPK